MDVDLQDAVEELPVGESSAAPAPEGSFGVRLAPNGTPIPTIAARRPALHGATDFVSWTWEMVNAGFDDIGWTDDGSRVVVRNPERLAQLVLPQFFRHSQYTSWVRALNAYSFKKVTIGQWEHPYFHRDKPHLLKKITRKSRERGAPAPSTALVGRQDYARLSTLIAEERSRLWWMQQEMQRLEHAVQQAQHEDLQQRWQCVSLAQYMFDQMKPRLTAASGARSGRAVSPLRGGDAEPTITMLSTEESRQALTPQRRLAADALLPTPAPAVYDALPGAAPPMRLGYSPAAGGGGGASTVAASSAAAAPPPVRTSAGDASLAGPPIACSRVNSGDVAQLDLSDLSQLYEDLDLSELGLCLGAGGAAPPSRQPSAASSSSLHPPSTPSPSRVPSHAAAPAALPALPALPPLPPLPPLPTLPPLPLQQLSAPPFVARDGLSSLSQGSSGHPVNAPGPPSPFASSPAAAVPTVTDLQRKAVEHYFEKLSAMAERALALGPAPAATAVAPTHLQQRV